LWTGACSEAADEFAKAEDKSGFKALLGKCQDEWHKPENWEKCRRQGIGQINQVFFSINVLIFLLFLHFALFN